MGLHIDNEPIACETSCSFSFNVDMKAVAPIESGRWSSSIPGIRSWQISVNANFFAAFEGKDFKTVLNAVLTGERMNISMRTNIGNSPYFIISGYAYPQSGELVAAAGESSNYSVVFVGDGPFTVESEAEGGNFWRIINAMPIEADKPNVLDTSF